MARKTKSAPVHAPTPKGLAVSDLRLRLEGLEKDNGKILGQIKKKQTELDNLFAQIETIRQELSQRTAPLMQKMYELDEQIHQAFTAILTGRKLGKKTRQDIEIIYNNMQAAGVISARSDGSSENTKSFFDADDQEEDEDSEEWYDYHRARPNLEKEPPKLDRDEQKKIRQIYLRLAEVFHPDKVLGDADQEYYAEVMKEINQAYQNGDLAKLLAIEKQHQNGRRDRSQ